MEKVYGSLLHTAELAQRKVKGIWDLALPAVILFRNSNIARKEMDRTE